jgi:ABC-type molybdate transport system ATPase subunit
MYCWIPLTHLAVQFVLELVEMRNWKRKVSLWFQMWGSFNNIKVVKLLRYEVQTTKKQRKEKLVQKHCTYFLIYD